LKPLPGYAERIPEVNKRVEEGLLQRANAPAGVLRTDNRLSLKTMILGLDVEGDSKAFPLSALRQMRVVNDTLGQGPILIVDQLGSDTTTAFSTRLEGNTLTFNPEATELIDSQTHSRWDPYVHCVAGKLRGSNLQPLILEPEYWFAWSEFHPGAAIFTRASSETR
jgi:hypothetical protein